jgi:hypothetical protein
MVRVRTAFANIKMLTLISDMRLQKNKQRQVSKQLYIDYHWAWLEFLSIVTLAALDTKFSVVMIGDGTG